MAANGLEPMFSERQASPVSGACARMSATVGAAMTANGVEVEALSSKLAFEGILFSMRYHIALGRLPGVFGGKACFDLRGRIDEARVWKALEDALSLYGRVLDGIEFDEAVRRAALRAPSKAAATIAELPGSKALRQAAELHGSRVRERIVAVADHLDGRRGRCNGFMATSPCGLQNLRRPRLKRNRREGGKICRQHDIGRLAACRRRCRICWSPACDDGRS